ncbi:porin [Burkholderia cepacia]|uniref:porin n=1 Tax=Burkholderia cepacia TaxID=292 RepID=UPI0007552B3E|nr:porin [Burkholderia cepacia]KVW88655.1 hypothetical protein WL00_12775 [Burkholderia cepacia]KVX72984.1 hypothetical protein WL07_12950 [Burkholderia cepacia]
MNKKILTIAVLATMAGVAHAQSSVTLYGVIDEGLSYVNHSASYGGKTNKLFEAQDGASMGSRWGVRGTEDLGNGLHAIFTLEGGYTLNNGALGQGGLLFGRQAFVGLKQDGVGSITFGRQYDLNREILGDGYSNGGLTVLGTWVYHNGDLDNLVNGRIDNAIKFKSANFSGLTFGALYGFSNAAGSFNGTNSFSGTTPTGSQRTISVGANYANGPFSVGGAYTDTTNPGQSGSTNLSTDIGSALGLPINFGVNKGAYTTGARDLRTFGFGGKMTYGPATAWVLGTDSRITSYASVKALTYYALDAGLSYYLTPALVAQGIYTWTGTTGGTGVYNAHWNTLGVALDYFLSKRTDVYAEVAGQEASGHDAEAQLGAGNGPAFAASGLNSKSQIAARLGMRTKF